MKIPEKIKLAVEEICNRLSKPRRMLARKVLVDSWKSDGVGVILRDNGVSYHAEWVHVERQDPEIPFFKYRRMSRWIGSCKVVVESGQACVCDDE